MIIDKIVNPVTQTNGRTNFKTYAHIKLSDSGKLSIVGVQGPRANGDCVGSCGQIENYLLEDVVKYMDGWDHDSVKKLQDIWKRWHLNDMRAGTPEQEDFIREWMKSNRYDYTAACNALKEAGLYEIDGYKYGHGWLMEEIPYEVVEWLVSLPESKTQPAWV